VANDPKGIFISYRRDETAGYAGWLSDALNDCFGEHRVFRDIDSIEPGLDFVEAIERAIDSSDVVLVVIGKNWLTATDESGQPRLQNPDDYVRLEIASALKRNIRVVPLLMPGASMPHRNELPDDLVGLTRRNAFPMNDSSWRDDARRLIGQLERVVEGSERNRIRERDKSPQGSPPGSFHTRLPRPSQEVGRQALAGMLSGLKIGAWIVLVLVVVVLLLFLLSWYGAF
jgi:hypothetical protein